MSQKYILEGIAFTGASNNVIKEIPPWISNIPITDSTTIESYNKQFEQNMEIYMSTLSDRKLVDNLTIEDVEHNINENVFISNEHRDEINHGNIIKQTPIYNKNGTVDVGVKVEVDEEGYKEVVNGKGEFSLNFQTPYPENKRKISKYNELSITRKGKRNNCKIKDIKYISKNSYNNNNNNFKNNNFINFKNYRYHTVKLSVPFKEIKMSETNNNEKKEETNNTEKKEETKPTNEENEKKRKLEEQTNPPNKVGRFETLKSFYESNPNDAEDYLKDVQEYYVEKNAIILDGYKEILEGKELTEDDKKYALDLKNRKMITIMIKKNKEEKELKEKEKKEKEELLKELEKLKKKSEKQEKKQPTDRISKLKSYEINENKAITSKNSDINDPILESYKQHFQLKNLLNTASSEIKNGSSIRNEIKK